MARQQFLCLSARIRLSCFFCSRRVGSLEDRHAHAGMNARTVVLWTAQEQKFFAKYGTDAQVIFIRQAPILLAGMSAGNVRRRNTIVWRTL
jgi:hypothetical protein